MLQVTAQIDTVRQQVEQCVKAEDVEGIVDAVVEPVVFDSNLVGTWVGPLHWNDQRSFSFKAPLRWMIFHMFYVQVQKEIAAIREQLAAWAANVGIVPTLKEEIAELCSGHQV